MVGKNVKCYFLSGCSPVYDSGQDISSMALASMPTCLKCSNSYFQVNVDEMFHFLNNSLKEPGNNFYFNNIF